MIARLVKQTAEVARNPCRGGPHARPTLLQGRDQRRAYGVWALVAVAVLMALATTATAEGHFVGVVPSRIVELIGEHRAQLGVTLGFPNSDMGEAGAGLGGSFRFGLLPNVDLGVAAATDAGVGRGGVEDEDIAYAWTGLPSPSEPTLMSALHFIEMNRDDQQFALQLETTLGLPLDPQVRLYLGAAVEPYVGTQEYPAWWYLSTFAGLHANFGTVWTFQAEAGWANLTHATDGHSAGPGIGGHGTVVFRFSAAYTFGDAPPAPPEPSEPPTKDTPQWHD